MQPRYTKEFQDAVVATCSKYFPKQECFEEVDINRIKVCNWHREDLGDITALAARIKDFGFLNPILVDSQYTLVAGYRRLEAAKRIGKKKVPVWVRPKFDDSLLALIAQLDENMCRKAYTTTEVVRLVEAIMEKGGAPARSKVAKALGMSERTYEMAKAVVEAADRDPVKYGEIREDMDRSGLVEHAHCQVVQQQGGEPDGSKNDGWWKAFKSSCNILRIKLNGVGLTSTTGCRVSLSDFAGQCSPDDRARYVKHLNELVHGLQEVVSILNPVEHK